MLNHPSNRHVIWGFTKPQKPLLILHKTPYDQQILICEWSSHLPATLEQMRYKHCWSVGWGYLVSLLCVFGANSCPPEMGSSINS